MTKRRVPVNSGAASAWHANDESRPALDAVDLLTDILIITIRIVRGRRVL